jgi:hypothetical protein
MHVKRLAVGVTMHRHHSSCGQGTSHDAIIFFIIGRVGEVLVVGRKSVCGEKKVRSLGAHLSTGD